MDAQRTPRGRRWGLSHEGAGGDSDARRAASRSSPRRFTSSAAGNANAAPAAA